MELDVTVLVRVCVGESVSDCVIVELGVAVEDGVTLDVTDSVTVAVELGVVVELAVTVLVRVSVGESVNDCVIVELGYPALRLFGLWRARWGARRAAIVSSLLIGIGAGNTVGFYEDFAYRAGWWKYEPANAMIGSFCALYVPVGEFLMFLTILPVAAGAVGEEERPAAAAVGAGVGFAAAIAAGYAVAYLALEAWR